MTQSGRTAATTSRRPSLPIATPESYNEMLDRAKAGKFAYPAINITSSQTVTAAIRGFAEAESDGILQVSVGGGEYASGSTIKDRVTGTLALARSEEHTSELQSRGHLVCRLLLEKKKVTFNPSNMIIEQT